MTQSSALYRLLAGLAFPATLLVAFTAFQVLAKSGITTTTIPYFIIMLVALIVVCLEWLIPYEASWVPIRNDITNDLLFMVAVQMLLPFLLSWFASTVLLQYREAWTLSLSTYWPRQWPVVAQLGLMLVSGEFFRYWLHVAAHNTATLWRLHAVHHSPKKLYWLNVGRFHPVEKALQYLLDVFPFIILGVGQEVVATYFIFYAVNGFYQHSNVDVRFGALNYLVSGPELHRWHHSRRIEESNNNYGNNLIVWDLIFGSWFLPRGRRVGDLGLINPRYPSDFLGQMAAPLTAGLDKREV